MSNTSQTTNYYEVLDVTPDAAPIDIERGYQKARALYSSDNAEMHGTFSADELAELLRVIEEAFRALSDPMKRKQYDESRSRGHVASQLGEVVDVTDDYVVRRRNDNTKPALGAGMARTAFSTYKTDPEIEHEIKETTVFDGSFLNKIRVYKNIPIEKMSESTRVSRTYLTAVEHNDYKNLPAPVFVRGYIVHMARILGLDENKVAASYMKILKEKIEK